MGWRLEVTCGGTVYSVSLLSNNEFKVYDGGGDFVCEGNMYDECASWRGCDVNVQDLEVLQNSIREFYDGEE